jgi:hypothetical protein
MKVRPDALGWPVRAILLRERKITFAGDGNLVTDRVYCHRL